MVHFSPSPLVLHQLTCQFANGETLFGPLNLSFDRRHCALVGRNGVGKSRLLRLLANEDAPSAGHVETHGTIVSVAQHTHNPLDVTLATWLGYDPIVDALARVQRGEMQVGDVELLEGN